MYKFLIILFFCFSIALVSHAQHSLDQKKIDAIEQLVQMGSLKFDYELDKAWIAPAIWNQYNIDAKENVAIYCSLYIRYKQNDRKTSPMVDMYDYKSGKHLASYGPIMGFRIKN